MLNPPPPPPDAALPGRTALESLLANLRCSPFDRDAEWASDLSAHLEEHAALTARVRELEAERDNLRERLKYQESFGEAACNLSRERRDECDRLTAERDALRVNLESVVKFSEKLLSNGHRDRRQVRIEALEWVKDRYDSDRIAFRDTVDEEIARLKAQGGGPSVYGEGHED